MRRHWFPKPYADLVARLRVPIGFLAVAAFFWLADPTRASLACGLPLAALGLTLRGWAAGHLEKNQRLATSGPYARVRNPLYLGTLMVAAGFALASRSLPLSVLFAAVFLLIYLPAVELEEQYLRALFRAFDQYASTVPMLLPRLRSASGGARFRWSLYMHNREYQALAGFLAAAAVLFWRAFR